MRWEKRVCKYTATLGRGVYDYRLEWVGGVRELQTRVGGRGALDWMVCARQGSKNGRALYLESVVRELQTSWGGRRVDECASTVRRWEKGSTNTLLHWEDGSTNTLLRWIEGV